MTEPETPARQINWILPAAAAVAAVFLLDLLTSLTYAVPMLYVLPLVLTWFTPGRRITVLATGVVLVLTWVGTWASSGEFTHAAAANRAMTSVLLLVIAGLVLQQKRLLWQRDVAHEAQSEADLRYRTMFEQAGVGVAQIDSRTGQFLRVNRMYCEVVGLTEAEMLGTTFMSITHPDDLAQDLGSMEQLRVGELTHFTMEKRYVKKDGSIVWVNLNVAPLWHPGEKPSQHIAVVQDITARKQAEAALIESEARARADLDAMIKLHELSVLSLQNGNVQSMLQKIVDTAIAITGSDFGNIQLLEADSAGLRIVAHRGFPNWWVEFWDSASRGQGVCGAALIRGERIIVEDVELSPIFAGTPGLEMHRKAGVRAVQSTPLMSRSGKMLGMFSTHHRRPHRLDERTVRLLDLLARQAGDFIENAESAEALRALNATLEERVKERTSALAEANERWSWVVHATNDGVWDWDLLHESIYFSPRWKEMHGFEESDPLESTVEWSARIHPEDRQRVLGKLKEYLAGTQPRFSEEYRIQRKDGRYFWVRDQGVAILNDEGRALRMVGADEDITWRKEAEEALHRREHEFRTLADNVPAFFSYIDRDYRYRFVNKRYEELLGRFSEEIVGMSVHDLHGPDSYAQVRPYLEKALAGESVSFEYEVKMSGGGAHYLSAQYVPDLDERGQIEGLFVLLMDVTALKSSESVLREREAQLRDLSAKLLQVQEEERRRIARDLHDDFTQRMAALALDLYRLRSAVPGLDSALSDRFRQAVASVEQLARDLQQLAHRLHPTLLEHVGLEAAAREYVDEFAERAGLPTEFFARDIPRGIPLGHATCLYRILQESLHNVKKHANATCVLVRLLRTKHGVGVCVHDDGRGIESVLNCARRKGLGLTSMAERVGALKGTFRIRTKPGDGTEIQAWVPIDGMKS